MNFKSLILPGVALGAASLIVIPQDTEAFTLIGGSLGIAQRDVRIFNNFSDPEDNNNQTVNPDFPGALGAAMAIWKGCVEWGSEQYGGNFTDPHQNLLGSDGGSPLANFDISWQGDATSTGGTNDNIHSQIGGSNGGVLAFCETPISNGWRIRYYEGWTWADGPAAQVAGVDMQGVACHEYGHALGLGHSSAGPATMFPSISGSGVAQRSIAADDKNGVRAIYGAADPGKPSLTSFSLNGSQLTINATNLDPTGNRVWFTRATPNATTGSVVSLTGVPSSNGQIVVTVPANAGPGTLQVRNSSGGGASLSNAVPFDPGDNTGPSSIGQVFCNSNTNSTGNVAGISAFGSDVVADNDVEFTADDMPLNQFGYFIMSDTQTFIFNFGGSQGNLCLGSPLVRFAGNVLNTGALGAVTFSPDLTALPGGTVISPGETWSFQMWYRDNNPGSTSNTTDGLQIPFN